MTVGIEKRRNSCVCDRKCYPISTSYQRIHHHFHENGLRIGNRNSRPPLNGMLTGIRSSFWGRGFESSASGICVLAVQNMVPELLRIGPNLSVCVSVCLSVQLLLGPVLDRFWTEFIRNFMKRALQKGVLATVAAPNSIISGATLPRSLHSPQVATAAPPSPLGPIGGAAVETCT